MAGDTLRELRLEPPPLLARLPPRRNLLNDKTGIGVQEGQGQIGPERVAAKVAQVQSIPGESAL